MKNKVWLITLILLLTISTVSATNLKANATDDTTINGLDSALGEQMWRGYLKFPIKDIPSGATITQADFVFYVTTVTGTPPTTHFYNCSNDWLESDDADTVLVPLPCTHLTGPLAGTQAITTTGLKIQDVLTQVKDSFNNGDKNFSIAVNVSAFFSAHSSNP
ncbi:hypothetical protein B6U80_01345, partial [Candidatus Pacearchaeota archaeon ex4484_26]